MLVENKMDLSIFDWRYNNDETGCTAYDPKILLKVVLFGYSRGFVGSRRLEWLCRNTVTCMALACMQHPDHSTFAAFVSSMHQEILSLFCDILLVCEEQQLLGGTVFALDGVKLPSNASRRWSGTLEELQQKQEKLEAKIEQLLAEHEEVDTKERWEERQPTEVRQATEPQHDENLTDESHNELSPVTERQRDDIHATERPHEELSDEECQSPSESIHTAREEDTQAGRHKNEKQRQAEHLKRLRRQAARIEEWLATHEPKIGKQGKEIQSNVTDNESAKMATSHGVIQGYNAQALADAKHQVIMAAEVFGDGTDSGHVSAGLAGAKQNMQALGHDEGYCAGKKLLADTSYHDDGNVKRCEEEHRDAYIPDPQYRKRDSRFASQESDKPTKKKRFRREDFQYDAKTKRYMCPNGKVLRLKQRALKRRSGVFRVYASKEKDCRSCELREQCLGGKLKTRRSLSIPVEQNPQPLTRSQQMSAKIDTEKGRRQYRQRFEIVEPVCANIRTQKRLDHFTLRGKQKVDIQWMLYSMVHNIEKIANYGKAA